MSTYTDGESDMLRAFSLKRTATLFILGLTLTLVPFAAADDLWDGAMGTPRVYPPRRHGAHFGPPTRSYSAFESPTTYGTHPTERCRSEVFSPRGIGVARRSGCERMDYSPYVLSTVESNHGPSYYTRHYLAPCTHPHCKH